MNVFMALAQYQRDLTFLKLVILQTISELRSSIVGIDVDNVKIDESIFPSQNILRSLNPFLRYAK